MNDSVVSFIRRTTQQSLVIRITGLLLFGVGAAVVSFHPSSAQASAELDRQFSLQLVGYLRAYDNVDGLFGDYVSQAYRAYFGRQTRFATQDLSKADFLLTQTKLPYQKVIEDLDILSQLSRSLRLESLVRTKVLKEGPRYRFQIDWIHPPKMDLVATEVFYLDEPRGGQALGINDIQSLLESALDRLIAKIPFKGQVTGRDGSSLTVNLGRDSNIKRGDVLMISTIEEVKRHPLLHTVVDWKFSPTGKVIVDQVEEGIAFCRLQEEEPGRLLARYQKIVQIISAPKPIPQVAMETHVETEEELETKRLAQTPRLGSITMGPWLGGFTREFSQGPTGGNSGSGLFFGARVDGELWLNRNFFVNLNFGGGVSSFTPTDVQTGTELTADSLGATTFLAKLAAGYNFFATPEFFGTKAFVRLGHQTIRFAMPVSAGASTGPTTYSGLFLGLGGEIPIRKSYGALLALDFGFLNGATQSGLSLGDSIGVGAVSFFIGAYKQITPRMRAKVGLDVLSTSADFDSDTTVSHRSITVLPQLVYFF